MTSAVSTMPLTQRLRRIQQTLGVHADGLLGAQTLSAIEDRLGITPPVRSVSLEASARSLEMIVAFEVTSKAVYQTRFRRPVWPGEASGVTIGIGYDIGVTAKAQIRLDWQGRIADLALKRLLMAQGITGANAKPLATSLADIDVPFEVAEQVFYTSTLPRFARLTRTTWPGVQKLPPDAQGALLSLIYNRGASLSGSRRKEMLALRPLIAGRAPNLQAIADLVASMARLWPKSTGLQIRRRQEATLIGNATRTYSDGELIRL